MTSVSAGDDYMFPRLAPACVRMLATLSAVSWASVQLPEVTASRMPGK